MSRFRGIEQCRRTDGATGVQKAVEARWALRRFVIGPAVGVAVMAQAVVRVVVSGVGLRCREMRDVVEIPESDNQRLQEKAGRDPGQQQPMERFGLGWSGSHLAQA